ncbi:hypothetical protein KAR91_24885 [Candidatus Pacearchaeota archaeon]|nr:hypothetical protein [Candidatus Pacearchaeota archaeon]
MKELDMDKLNEEFQAVEELLRKAYELITPTDMHSDMKWYLDRDMRKAQQEKNPKCWMMLGKAGREVPFFPICNVMGMTDPKSIDFSLKMATKLKDKPEVDQDRLTSVMHKLQVMKTRYGHEVPKPADMAAKKAGVTKNMNSVKKYLQKLKGKAE